jgi:hypothetical protein|tara:strand:+ start:2069 stop:2695 length:627 start_codon:yes stop_codon:yes gene_type:complete
MSFGYHVLGFGSYPNRSSSGGNSGSGIALGLTPSLLTLSGQSQPYSAAVNNNTIDLSNVGGVDYTSETARLVFLYEKGSSYTGDIQIYDIEFSSTSYDINSGTNNFETTRANDQIYTSASWWPVPNGTSGGRWNRDAGGTGSSGTGLTISGEYYFYAETSSPAANVTGYKFWLRSDPVTLSSSSPNLTFKDARYGAGIGTLNVHLDIQ